MKTKYSFSFPYQTPPKYYSLINVVVVNMNTHLFRMLITTIFFEPVIYRKGPSPEGASLWIP